MKVLHFSINYLYIVGLAFLTFGLSLHKIHCSVLVLLIGCGNTEFIYISTLTRQYWLEKIK